MEALFSKILSNGKNVTGEAPPVDTPTGPEVIADIKSKLSVDAQGIPHHRHRRTQAEMAAARAAGESPNKKIICPIEDVPDMPTGVGVVRSGIQVNEAYPMITRMLGDNRDMIIMYLRTLVLKSVFAQDQRSKEEYKYMREFYKMEVIS